MINENIPERYRGRVNPKIAIGTLIDLNRSLFESLTSATFFKDLFLLVKVMWNPKLFSHL